MAFCKYTPCTAKLFGTSHFTDRPHTEVTATGGTHTAGQKVQMCYEPPHKEKINPRGFQKLKNICVLYTYLHVSAKVYGNRQHLFDCSWCNVKIPCTQFDATIEFHMPRPRTWFELYMRVFCVVMNKKRLCRTKTRGISASRKCRKRKKNKCFHQDEPAVMLKRMTRLLALTEALSIITKLSAK